MDIDSAPSTVRKVYSELIKSSVQYVYNIRFAKKQTMLDAYFCETPDIIFNDLKKYVEQNIISLSYKDNTWFIKERFGDMEIDCFSYSYEEGWQHKTNGLTLTLSENEAIRYSATYF